ncbi:RsmB/NOP family class I SAM-dependent RNA methyltransferase [Shewanella sp. SNU WT4]|uniref:RsmB/NOP family class I SAM-dependent RNA methyltransferase n=1 Tax=Shewanella sp. SNU WT4 TaxID=2590015 RepID=UPI00112DF0CF|nr:RsmB/NOP family class I SAM-dependent RNA methyltransferase [Shewanella sp. SNU WT4]QDF67789.1 RsmB/NOP family class I SAM-dependent RNA methyltransferase [Shewanella sp. SNU WT4]
MGNPTPLASAPTLTLSSHKRAYSYAVTISHLFADIHASHLPADRVIGQYFRDNKKHGSKDRRVIRESLFSMFRWWGWLAQFSNGEIVSKQAPLPKFWFQQLCGCAQLEQHSWQDIITAWHELGDLFVCPDMPSETLEQKAQMLQQVMPSGVTLTLEQLVPAWFWQVTEISEHNKPRLIAAMTSRPPIWARAQGVSVASLVTELQQQGIDAKASEYFSDALSLGHKSINLNDISQYQQGKIEIQDLASQVIGQVCAPKPNQQWWDACSGAGGKSLQLASLMKAQGQGGSIVASDIRQHALDELIKRAKRAKVNNISIARWRSDELPVAAGSFDGVLVDAPCSCTGTWRRNPDMRWLDTQAVVDEKPQLQLDILTRCSRAVKAGGVLVYATCSVAAAENELVVKAFLAQHPEFSIETIAHPFTGEASQMLTIWPYEADSDAMFVCRMRRI